LILEKIVKLKKEQIELKKKKEPISFLEEREFYHLPPREFKSSLLLPGISLIAELKKASPSSGVIRKDFFLEELAEKLEKGGARALSVLTEEHFFLGKLDYLEKVKRSSSLPLLRKDFIIDPYQVFQTKAYGGDALLLITGLLEKEKLRELISLSKELSLSPLVEVHSEEEVEIACEVGAEIIGVNQRNLHTLRVEKNLAEKLITFIPEGKVVVAESGITSLEEVVSLERAGFDAVLVGEYLMRGDPLRRTKELISKEG
jgi:indole-3-glycerol phosphate synthase